MALRPLIDKPITHPDNFWSFTAGAIIFLFVLYLTKVGSLPKWAAILFYKPAPAETVGNPGKAPATAEVGPSKEHPAIAPGQSNTGANDWLNRHFGVPPTFDPWKWIGKQLGL